jgi:hypothetical protein
MLIFQQQGDDDEMDERIADQNSVKRYSSEEFKPKPKRVKKEPTTKKAVKKAPPRKKKVESESDLTDLNSDAEEDVKPKTALGKARPKKNIAQSDEEDIKSDMDSSAGRKRKRPMKRAKVEAGSDEEETEKKVAINKASKHGAEEKYNGKAEEENSEVDVKPQVAAKHEEDTKSSAAADDDSSELSSVVDDTPPKIEKVKRENNPAVDDDSSDLSSVIDDAPPPKKRKAKEPKGSKGSSKSRQPKPAPKELTGDEAEIKKLQGQLVKCGIRKIWGIELKDCGDSTRAKIQHLRRMLTDVGMTGRFSEAKAKEIKERRELLADLGAVQEMNDLWGAEGRGGRVSRSKARAPMKEESEEESESGTVKPRVTKRMADLAFLGSESESE